MLLPLTEDYIASKFFQNCGKPFYNKVQKVYQGSCPICREGSSWLKKRRCYYIVKDNAVCCHNCGWYSSPYNWVKKVTGLTFTEIKKELESFDSPVYFSQPVSAINKPEQLETLPADAINLFDQGQVEYYSQNAVVKRALGLITNRRLDTAINRPKGIFLSLADKTHDNRLIIPFYDQDNKIVHYQTRSILEEDTRPKYLSKRGSEKSLYGINNISYSMEYLFLTEGPIDAMFIQNGVAVAGINESKTKTFTEVQLQQLQGFPLYKKIWVLDNQHLDNTSKNKTKSLINSGETVFIWPESCAEYKDVNDYCVDKKISSFDTDFIIENSYSGLKGRLLVSGY